MLNLKLPIHKTVLTFLILAVTSACSNANFSGSNGGGGSSPTSPPAPGTNTTQGSSPTDPSTPPVTSNPSAPGSTSPGANNPPGQCLPGGVVEPLTKIMFLVDTSGSNYGVFGIGGTDPKKKFRLGSIENFFQRYSANTNLQWGFMTFSGHHAHDFIGHEGVDSFTSSPDVMQRALNHFSHIQDWGSTPYKAALSHVIKAVANDKDVKSASNPRYIIVLLSDGFPTDIDDPKEIQAKIQELLAVDSGSISLSTVFYGHKHEFDADDAINLLTDMAEMGHGQFANATDPKSTLNFDDLIPLPVPCPQ